MKILNLNHIFKRFVSTNPVKYDYSGNLLCQGILNNKDLSYLASCFVKRDYDLMVAGGAVRDAVSNIRPFDIDLATNALPDQIVSLCEQENIRILNFKGLSHGTVPVRINDNTNFEITTLRIDKITDGRHAIVEFTNDWNVDAHRRDFTINSLFLDFNGIVHDYVNGMEDIKKRLVRFVGNADERIKEDYLRILRYFRFFGRISDNPMGHDEQSLTAIKNNINGLKSRNYRTITFK
jgi:tRNA nucleotidyltransferase (CCA-adding enzyme)